VSSRDPRGLLMFEGVLICDPVQYANGLCNLVAEEFLEVL